MVILWAVALQTILSLQWMEMQSFIHNLGDFLDIFGGYLVVRFFIPDGETVRRAIKTLAVVCIIQGVCMLNEQISHVNVFGYIGGYGPWLTIRDGKIRSEGVLGCISAGGFAGALIPLFLWLVDGTKMPEPCVCGSRRCDGYGIHVEFEHVTPGACSISFRYFLLAPAQADALGSLGIRADSGGVAFGR